MNYKYGLTVPASTAASDPMEIAVKLPSGNVSEVTLGFPAGCEGLVGVRILQGFFQLWPITSNEWLLGDDHTFEISANHLLIPGQSRLRIHAYNTDSANDHTISVHFNIEVLEDTSKKHLGVVTSVLPESVLEDLTVIREIYENALEFRKLIDDKMLPVLDGIWQRLDPELSVRLRDLSLEELSKL